ncbi:LacI family DNA-binding transcriptional regulator [Microbacterium xanthum]|uniref:LacI family DNA-binding transcriptional regulator n=1 Tax=Microbacterium xanthum TaxID=3079794 RepID=UPI002AD27FA9|nr:MULTISPECIES: LacI family DNA-binding transcriptional regulator [unclassified Microbacterium]MDZ8171172.1 LacI family DNA-binding transcriptional regulator [Microbacterium sp. KSW-48]MDZ8201689.1 LacI family DNA-binding transcriptional regulator [Microbacterium sp. SSW1-59]
MPADVAERIVRRGGNATIYDIADVAGVSPSTVSRALSTPGRISAKTEARIRQAADRLDFRANPMARGLHTGRTQTLALLVADITNPVVFGVVRGAEHEAAKAGYTLIVAESQESGETEAEATARLMPSVDGIILASTRLHDGAIRATARRKPTVLINRAIAGVDSVLPDVDKGVGEVIAHLDGLGHRSIAYLAGPDISWVSARRWERLLEAAEAAGIAIVEIGPTAPTIEGGRGALRRVVAARPSAVVAFNDLIAIGLMQAAAQRGIDVPRDLSVVGFDNVFGSELMSPAVTTVASELELAGRRAVRVLLARLQEEPVADATELLKTTLIVRESTGPAAGREARAHRG